jgi:predicted metal-binding membrane protein
VMNPAWIGALALYVLLEKSAPAGHWMIKVVGWVLILTGLATLAVALR